MTATEYVVLVDDKDNEIGVAEKLAAHEQNLLHRAFSIFIFRENNGVEVLLQQRALHKYHSGGLWTNTCCSHPRPGEDILAAGQRRLREEFGFAANLNDLGWFHYNAHFENGLAENEIDHVLIGNVEKIEIIPNQDEIQAYRWAGVAEVNSELASHPERFTPWFKQAFSLACEGLSK
jgi:isopentenyl-diphosphate delta-isomerase type 1